MSEWYPTDRPGEIVPQRDVVSLEFPWGETRKFFVPRYVRSVHYSLDGRHVVDYEPYTGRSDEPSARWG